MARRFVRWPRILGALGIVVAAYLIARPHVETYWLAHAAVSYDRSRVWRFQSFEDCNRFAKVQSDSIKQQMYPLLKKVGQPKSRAAGLLYVCDRRSELLWGSQRIVVYCDGTSLSSTRPIKLCVAS